VVGLVCGVAYVLWTKREMATYELPFGSFLGLAALAVSIREVQLHLHH